jgi:hypothetical protein
MKPKEFVIFLPINSFLHQKIIIFDYRRKTRNKKKEKMRSFWDAQQMLIDL